MDFYDYRTETVNGSDVVDRHRTGMSFYDDFILGNQKTLDYLRDKKNLKGEVVMMSPEEYFKECSNYGFLDSHPSVETLKQQRASDKKILDHLRSVLTVYKRKFPMPMINKAQNGQEGLHRMMVIGDMFGWDHKVPVLIVDWADKQRAFEDQKRERKERIEYNIRQSVQEALRYKFTNIEELKEQLQWELDRQFKYNDDGIDIPVKFELTNDEQNDCFIVSIGAASYDFDYDEVQFIDSAEDDSDIDDIDLDDVEDFLRRHFGDNWRKTHPHLKNTFNIEEKLTTKTVRRDNPNDFSPFGYKVDFYDGDKQIGEGSVCGIKDDNAFLYDFEVYPEFRGKGYSKEMLQYLIDQYDLKQLYVDQDNTIAINLYKKYGFKVDDEVDDDGKPAYSMLRENKAITEESFDVDEIKQMDEIIQSRWAFDIPGEGCIFIAPNGKFINIYPKLDDHEDLCYWLEELDDYNFNTPEDAEWFVIEFGYVRCRNSMHLCFIELPQKMTREQYYSLEQWLEEKVSSDKIDIEAWSGEWKTYHLDNYFPEDIIKIIKRSYASGKLYEKLK